MAENTWGPKQSNWTTLPVRNVDGTNIVISFLYWGDMYAWEITHITENETTIWNHVTVNENGEVMCFSEEIPF